MLFYKRESPHVLPPKQKGAAESAASPLVLSTNEIATAAAAAAASVVGATKKEKKEKKGKKENRNPSGKESVAAAAVSIHNLRRSTKSNCVQSLGATVHCCVGCMLTCAPCKLNGNNVITSFTGNACQDVGCRARHRYQQRR